jgi:methyl-accepting chemotaxis protein
MKFHTQLLLGNGVVLTLVIIIAAVVYQSVNSLLETSKWVTFTHEVIEKGESLQKLVRDQQTGMRGFLITGQEVFLEPYNNGKEQFEKLIFDVKETIQQHSGVTELVDLLDTAHEKNIQWHEEVAQPIIAKRRKIVKGAKDIEYLEELLGAGLGKSIMDEIRVTLDKLRSNLKQREDRSAEILLISIAKDMIDQETGERGFLVTGREEFLEPYQAGQKALEGHLVDLKPYLMNEPENIKLFNKVKSLATQWVEKAAKPEIAVRREVNKNTVTLKDIAAFITSGNDKKLVDEIQKQLEDFNKKEKELLVVRREAAEATVDRTIYITLFGAAFAVAFGIIVILFLTHNIMKMVNRVVYASLSVSNAAEEISQGNTNLSQRTEQQAASLEETAASMEQITGTVQQNTDNARRASDLALNARERAEEGGQIVGNAVGAMGEINRSSKQVADIIGVIDDIAFQTNLLALNAAVEAARAGEQGRGFAVVATEVRSLAQRSAAAAKEIKGLIQDSVGKTEEGTRLVNQSGKTLEEIVGAVRKVSDIVVEIASASEEQSSGIQQVNKAVTQLDEITQQNAALVEEATTASEAMKEQALSLKEHVDFFNRSKTNLMTAEQTRTRGKVAPRKGNGSATAAKETPKSRDTSPKNKQREGEWHDF